jgi:ABC-type transport system involved in cytochrome bd biosynthesis fused ATPase/permease subunit
MNQLAISLVNWNNGIIMIGVFVAVVIVLVLILINFMNSEKKK